MKVARSQKKKKPSVKKAKMVAGSLKKKVAAKGGLKKKVVKKTKKVVKKTKKVAKKGGSDWLVVNYARGPSNTPASGWDGDGSGPVGWLSSQQLQQKSCSGGAKKKRVVPKKRVVKRGGGSDWLTVHNARGPSNTPGPWDNPSPMGWSNNKGIRWMNRNDPLQSAGSDSTFKLFARDAQYIPSTQLAYAAAPQLTGKTPSCVGGAAKKKKASKKVAKKVSKKKVTKKVSKKVSKKKTVRRGVRGGGGCSPTFAAFAPCSEYVPNQQLAKWIAPQLTGSVGSMCHKN